MQDLENDTQSQLFQKELLKMDPAKLSEKGITSSLTYSPGALLVWAILCTVNYLHLTMNELCISLFYRIQLF